MSVNRVILVGTVSDDVKQRETKGGLAVNFSVLTTEEFDGKVYKSYHRCSVFGERAAKAAAVLSKGALVSVEGALKTRSYVPRGETKKAYITEVNVKRVELEGAGAPSAVVAPAAQAAADDDVPF